MFNVELKVDGDILTATVDLSKDCGKSASGKTIVIGSTKGNQQVPGSGHESVRIGLNVYKYPTG